MSLSFVSSLLFMISLLTELFCFSYLSLTNYLLPITYHLLLKVQHGESTNMAGKVDKTIDPN